MALLVVNRPDRFVNQAYGNNTFFSVIETSATQLAKPNFKFVFEVQVRLRAEDGSVETQFHRYSIKPNNEGNGTFNVAQLMQDYATTDIEIYYGSDTQSTHKGTLAFGTNRFPIHLVDKYSPNKSNLIQASVAVCEYHTEGGVDNIDNFQGIGLYYNFWNGAMSYDYGTQDYDDAELIPFSDNKMFLSDFDSGIERKVRRTDYHTLAFFNGRIYRHLGNSSTASVMGQIHELEFKFYSSTGLISTSTIENSVANGGRTYGNTFSTTVDHLKYGLLYAGVGVANLTNAGVTVPANTAYYTVRGKRDTGTYETALYTIRIQDEDCKGFETIRLAYLNRLGAWDYYNFNKKSIRTVNTNRGLMSESNTRYNEQTTAQQSFIGGSKVYRSQSKEVIEANTDFISEQEATALESLFTSPQVYMQRLADGDAVTGFGIQEDTFVPVVVTENTYTKQTTSNDGLKQYVIQIEKSNPRRIQRL